MLCLVWGASHEKAQQGLQQQAASMKNIGLFVDFQKKPSTIKICQLVNAI